MATIKSFDTTWHARKHTKRCRECSKLIKDGERVHGELFEDTVMLPISGVRQRTYWYFWHIEHGRCDIVPHTSSK